MALGILKNRRNFPLLAALEIQTPHQKLQLTLLRNALHGNS